MSVLSESDFLDESNIMEFVKCEEFCCSQEMAIVHGFPLTIFKPPTCMTLAQHSSNGIVQKSNELERSGSLTPLPKKGMKVVGKDDQLADPFGDAHGSLELIEESFLQELAEMEAINCAEMEAINCESLLAYEMQYPDHFEYDVVAISELLAFKSEIRLDFKIWFVTKGNFVPGIKNTKIVPAIGKVKKFVKEANGQDKTCYFVDRKGDHHTEGQSRENPGLHYCCFLFDKEKGTKEMRMYRCGIRKQFTNDGPKLAMLDEDIKRIVRGDIAMPKEIKEKPIIPLISKELEKEYSKRGTEIKIIKPKKESRNEKSECGSKKRKRIGKSECDFMKRKRTSTDKSDGSRHSSNPSFINLDVLQHDANLVQDDMTDDEDDMMDF